MMFALRCFVLIRIFHEAYVVKINASNASGFEVTWRYDLVPENEPELNLTQNIYEVRATNTIPEGNIKASANTAFSGETTFVLKKAPWGCFRWIGR